jgi:hypothetical protein
MLRRGRRPHASGPFTDLPDVENLVPELVPISPHIAVPEGTEAGPKPRFSPQMDLP